MWPLFAKQIRPMSATYSHLKKNMYVGPSTLLDYIHGHIVTLIKSRPVCPKTLQRNCFLFSYDATNSPVSFDFVAYYLVIKHFKTSFMNRSAFFWCRNVEA